MVLSPDTVVSARSSVSSAAPILSVVDVVKCYGGNRAVDGLSLEVGRGEMVGLIGPNGAGKTTMFDLLAGSQKPNQGRIVLDGHPIESLAAHHRATLGLGKTFQVPRPFGALSVVENVMLGRQGQRGESILPNWFSPRRVSRDERDTHAKAMEFLRFVTLAPLADQPARILSGGQRKLLELARVLMGEPQLLLLDEPAAGVNPALLDIIIEKIIAINRRGITVFLIEHNMDMVARLCSRVFLMAEGKLLCDGTPDAVARDPRVIEAYLGQGFA